MRSRGSKLKFHWIMAWLVYGNVASATEPVGKFGPERPVELVDFGVHLIDDEAYTEEWSHEVSVEDGSFIGIDFGLTNLGIGDHKGAVRLTYVSPDGKKTTCRTQCADGKWSASREGYSLQFAKSKAEGDLKGIRLDLSCKKLAVKLDFTNEAPPLRPGGGVLSFGDSDGVYSMVFTSPRSKVTGTLTLEGNTKQVQGIGHASHSYTTMYPHKQVHRWFRFKALRKDISIILAEMESAKDYGYARNGWALLLGPDGRIAASTRVNFEFDGFIKDGKSSEGYTIPRRVRLAAVDGDAHVTGVLLMKDIKSIHDPTDDLDAISRVFIRRFTKPKEYKINCTYKFRVVTKKEDRLFEGEGLYRFVYINP